MSGASLANVFSSLGFNVFFGLPVRKVPDEIMRAAVLATLLGSGAP